ncbi:hypothetical protein [Chitinophaga sp.]|uniref:hypothetical protein n=1 Tax=Chitinophaga sp. TaxID=1869181 RepID=UPI0031DB9312
MKIYIWIGMILSGILFLAGVACMVVPLFLSGNAGLAVQGVFAAVMAAFIFSITASLWFEKKWAIRYNWVVGVIYGCLVLANIVVGGAVATYIMALLSIPYWVMLYKIQRSWENNDILENIK